LQKKTNYEAETKVLKINPAGPGLAGVNRQQNRQKRSVHRQMGENES
jgi:hypothetical protein